MDPTEQIQSSGSASPVKLGSPSKSPPSRPLSNKPLHLNVLGGSASELALSRSLNALLPDTLKKKQINEYQHTSSPHQPVSFYTRWNLPPYEEAVKAVESLLVNVAITFYIYEPHYIRDLLSRVYAGSTGLDTARLEEGCSDVCIVEFYEVIASIALGAQYDETIPVLIAERCFETARYALDECIEGDEIRSLTLLTLLTIYQLLEKRRSCWRYISTGLQIARSNGLHLRTGPPNESDNGLPMSANEWQRYKKLRRTMVFLESWLGATLGRMPITVQVEDFDEIIDDIMSSPESDPTYTTSLQSEIVKIGLLSAQILQDVQLTSTPTLSAVSHYMAKLESWFVNLPYPLRLNALVDGEVCGKEQRASMLLGHCLYLSAVILVTRRIFFEIMNGHETGGRNFKDSWIVGADGTLEEAMKYYRSCHMAANQTGRVLGLIMSQGTLIKKCWVAIYTAFHSSLILLFNAFQQRRSFPGHLPETWSEEYVNSKKCLAALEQSAESDQLSAYYLEILESIRKYMGLEGPFTRMDLDDCPDASDDTGMTWGVVGSNGQQARGSQNSDSCAWLAKALRVPTQSVDNESRGGFIQSGEKDTDTDSNNPNRPDIRISTSPMDATGIPSGAQNINYNTNRDTSDLDFANKIYNIMIESGKNPFINDDIDMDKKNRSENSMSRSHSSANSPLSPHTIYDSHLPLPPGRFSIIQGGDGTGLRRESFPQSLNSASPLSRKRSSVISVNSLVTGSGSEREWERETGIDGSSGPSSNSDNSQSISISTHHTPGLSKSTSRSTSISSALSDGCNSITNPNTGINPPSGPSSGMKRGIDSVYNSRNTDQKHQQHQQHQFSHHQHHSHQHQQYSPSNPPLPSPQPQKDGISPKHAPQQDHHHYHHNRHYRQSTQLMDGSKSGNSSDNCDGVTGGGGGGSSRRHSQQQRDYPSNNPANQGPKRNKTRGPTLEEMENLLRRVV